MQLVSSVFSLGMILSATLAAPVAPATSSSGEPLTVTRFVDSEATSYRWDEGWNKDFIIHSSCNNSQYNQIYAGLQEAKLLATHAKDHVLRFGNESDFFGKYFGNSSTAEVVGWYDGVVNGDKGKALFRCDNPDGNCANDGWAGHWRGENGTDETVICDFSYENRLYLSQVCSRGYTVANSKNTLYWASDLLHRIWHTSMGQGTVGHFADSYEDCLALAKDAPNEAVRNSDTLRFFALDVYAYDVAVPGVGCTGELENQSSESSASASSSAAASAATSESTTKTSSTSASSTTKETSSAKTLEEGHCHTHEGGEVHCV